jgi:hypothetical protein
MPLPLDVYNQIMESQPLDNLNTARIYSRMVRSIPRFARSTLNPKRAEYWKNRFYIRVDGQNSTYRYLLCGFHHMSEQYMNSDSTKPAVLAETYGGHIIAEYWSWGVYHRDEWTTHKKERILLPAIEIREISFNLFTQFTVNGSLPPQSYYLHGKMCDKYGNQLS